MQSRAIPICVLLVFISNNFPFHCVWKLILCNHRCSMIICNFAIFNLKERSVTFFFSIHVSRELLHSSSFVLVFFQFFPFAMQRSSIYKCKPVEQFHATNATKLDFLFDSFGGAGGSSCVRSKGLNRKLWLASFQSVQRRLFFRPFEFSECFSKGIPYFPSNNVKCRGVSVFC